MVEETVFECNNCQTLTNSDFGECRKCGLKLKNTKIKAPTVIYKTTGYTKKTTDGYVE